jgi:nucleotide-binding universal stress UspA family protein
MARYKKILVALDLNEESGQILERAVELSEGDNLNLVYV